MIPKCRYVGCEKDARRYPPSRNKKDGTPSYHKYCSRHNRIVYEKKHMYKQYKKSTCEKCGFVPEHPCQLDVDHIDGNKGNMDVNNLQTLCANCHRLKTHMNKDHNYWGAFQ